MARSWLETRVDVPSDAAELVGACLLDLGSPGLVTEEHGPRTVLLAYFDEEHQVAGARAELERLGVEGSVAASLIQEENWAENWKEHFPPLAVGARLYLCPPWLTHAPTDRVRVVVDPGMAFGTGHHTTTRACLELLERCLVPGCSLLDVGTGSGVLSIAALLLGARSAVGVDVDPLATEAAAANAARNGVAERSSFVSSLDQADGVFDVAVANIQLNVLVELEERIAARVKPGGTLIASGLLRHELDEWKACYAENWVFGETAGDEQWVAVAAQRRDVVAPSPPPLGERD